MRESLRTPWESEGNSAQGLDRFLCFGQEWASSVQGLFALLLLSLMLKVVLYFMADVISNDGPRYINQALMFAEGNWRAAIEVDPTFLYPLLIAALGQIGVDLVHAGQILSLVASVLVLIPLYLIFRGIFNGKVAVFGCLAFIVSPSMNKFSVSVMRDPLFLLVFAWLAYFVWRTMKEAKIRYFIAIFILSLLSSLLRLEGLLMLPILFLFFLVIFSYKNASVKLVSFGIAIIIAIFFIGTMLLNSRTESDNVGHQRFQQLYTAINSIKNYEFFEYNSILKQKLKEMELSIPRGVAQNDFAEIASDHIRIIYLIGLISTVADDIWLPFFGIFLFGLYKSRVMSKDAIFLCLFIFPYLFLAYFFNIKYGFLDERYVYIPVMIFFCFVGFGLEIIANKLCKLPFGKVAVLLFIFLLIGIPASKAIKQEAKNDAFSSRLAGEWLAAKPEFGEMTLIANGEKIPFYSGRRRNFICDLFSPLTSLYENALNGQIDLVTIEMRKSNITNLPDFTGYSLIAKFEDPRHVAMIYHRNP